MKKILICPPKYFDIKYEINPWMHIDIKVNREKVVEECESLKKLYLELGVELFEINPDENFPDMVYTANYGFITGNTFVKSNLKFQQREKESDLAAAFFKKEFGMEIASLPKNINFEGQGDLLNGTNKLFMGWGKRTDKSAKKYLEELIGKEIVDLKLVDPYFYHLDTCFAVLNNETVMINPSAFTDEGKDNIRAHFKNIIEVSQEDNKKIACNLVVIGKSVAIAKGISQKLREKIENQGYTVFEVEMDEYIKGGGSVKCLSLEF